MKKLQAIFFFIISFILIGNSFKYQFDFINIIISVLNLLLLLIYFKRHKRILTNIASYIVLTFIFFSLNLYAFGNFVGLMGEIYTYEQKESLAIFGNNVMLCFLLGSFIFRPSKKNNINSTDSNLLKPPFSKDFIYFIIIFAYTLSIISYSLGIGKMGSEGVPLPFKLGGIIILTRTDIIPIILMLIVARNWEDPSLKIYLIIFFIWAVLETFVMLSKSRLVYIFLPSILYYILREQKISKSLIKSLLPVIVIFILLYPIISALRYVRSESLISSKAIKESKELNEKMEGNQGNEGFRIQLYNRTFLAGQHYMNAYYETKNEDLFNFSRLPVIILLRGSAVYETQVIEGFPETASHSSGTTGITDPLLLGGAGFSYLTIFLFTFLASLIDSERLNRKILFKVFFLMLFINFIQIKSYSLFLDVLILPFIGCKTIDYILINNSYKKTINLIK